MNNLAQRTHTLATLSILIPLKKELLIILTILFILLLLEGVKGEVVAGVGLGAGVFVEVGGEEGLAGGQGAAAV